MKLDIHIFVIVEMGCGRKAAWRGTSIFPQREWLTALWWGNEEVGQPSEYVI